MEADATPSERTARLLRGPWPKPSHVSAPKRSDSAGR